MKILNGLGISPGLSSGPVFLIDTTVLMVESDQPSDPASEIIRLDMAVELADSQLQEACEKTSRGTSADIAAVFEAHRMILQDPEIVDRVKRLISQNHFSAAYAWNIVINENVKSISSLQSEVFSERSIDFFDVGQRVLRILQGSETQTRLIFPSVLVAEELTPSDIISLDRNKILAICIAHGGPTSHAAILAKALGIPAVSGLGPWLFQFTLNQLAIVDGSSGIVILDPDKKEQENFITRLHVSQKDTNLTPVRYSEPALSSDEHPFRVTANISSADEAIAALNTGADGIGLLRTEFLFLDRDTPPTEEEQYQVYRDIFSFFQQKPVTVRTLDIGGDKPAPYLKVPKTRNPFLGLRGIRLALKREEILQTQLRALLRAGVGYNVKIMFPMIGTLDELRSARNQLSHCSSVLDQNGQEYRHNCEIGMMIEVPSAAVMADVFIDEVDFFSIGTNDLTQYTLAADRTNPQVAEFADALDPSILRLVDNVIKVAHQAGKYVALCGELASDPLAVSVLMGFHIDEFSMNSRSIPSIKEKIRKLSLVDAEKISTHVRNLSSKQEIRRFLEHLEEK